MTVVRVAVLGLASLWTASPAPTDGSPGTALPDELARVLTDYEDAWKQKDAAGLAQLFTDDGFVMSPGHPPVRGRAAIREHYSGHGGPLALRVLDFAVEGSTGFVLGGYARAEGEPDIGKFTLTLKKGADGRWLIHSDMDNANTPR